MPVRRKTGLDFAATALSRHLRAMEARQANSESGELNAADLALIVRATGALVGLEEVRANVVLKAIGRRIDTMPTAELERLFNHIEGGQDVDEETSGN